MSRPHNLFVDNCVAKAYEPRSKAVLKAHRDMFHRVGVRQTDDGGVELRWRKPLRLKSYRRWSPSTMQVKFAEAHGDTKVLGKRICYGHGIVFGTGKCRFVSGTVISAFLDTMALPAEDGQCSAQYFTELEDRIDALQTWPDHVYCGEDFSDRALVDIVEKAGIRSIAYHGVESRLWTPTELVKWWLDFTVGVQHDHLIWKRATVRGGPNAVKVGDPVAGMFVDPIGRVVTVSGVMFLVDDVMHYLVHDRFPWEPAGTQSPWKEVNWDD